MFARVATVGRKIKLLLHYRSKVSDHPSKAFANFKYQ